MLIRIIGVIALVLSLTTGLLSISHSASAESTGDDLSVVEQIVVTGARTPLDIHQVGSGSTIIGREDINRQQARYITDVLRTVPGFAVSQAGVAGTQTQVRVRGSEANHVLVLIDGVRANDPATGDEFRWEYLSTSNIKRIEIIRGAQSALWGSDAIGAVVHVVTRRGAKRNDLNIYAEHGSHDTFNAGVDGTTQIGDWSLSGALESLQTDGENISRSGDESDGADLVTGAASATYSWSETAGFNVGLRFVDASSSTDAVDFFNTGLPVDGDLETHSDNLIADIGSRWLAHDDRVAYKLSARYYDSQHRNLTDGIEGSSSASERITLVLQSDLQLDEDRLSLALEYEDTDFKQRGAIVFGDPNQNQNMQVFSAVAEYQYLSGEKLTWQLGGRYDSHSDFDNVFTGKASLVYPLAESARLRASIGVGHKTPTFTDRFGFFPSQFVGNPELKPETSISYEIGLDMDFFERALQLQTSVYVQKLKDEINGFVFDPTTFLGTAENQSGKSDRSGVELAAKWSVLDRVSIVASYTYAESKEQNVPGVKSREVRRPRHSGNVSFNYLSGNTRLNAFLSANYGGERTDSFFPPFPNPQEIVTLNGYWLINLTLNYQLKPGIAVFARGTNLLDEHYEQVFGFQTLGRAGYVGIRFSLGN